jgi:hypothetical protein
MRSALGEMVAMRHFFAGVRQGMKAFGETVATIVNSLLLSIVYFIGVGITWLFLRLGKKELMDLRLDAKAKTYWKELDIKTRKRDLHYRQF